MICCVCNRPISRYEKLCPVCGAVNKEYIEIINSETLTDDSAAILAFSFSLIAMISFPFPYFCLPTSLLGIIFGLKGMRKRNRYYMSAFGLTNSVVMFIITFYYLIQKFLLK